MTKKTKMTKKIKISKEFNIVMDWHLDTTSNFTNAFDYNFAITIYDVKNSTSYTEKQKKARAYSLCKILVDFFEKDKTVAGNSKLVEDIIGN